MPLITVPGGKRQIPEFEAILVYRACFEASLSRTDKNPVSPPPKKNQKTKEPEHNMHDAFGSVPANKANRNKTCTDQTISNTLYPKQ